MFHELSCLRDWSTNFKDSDQLLLCVNAPEILCPSKNYVPIWGEYTNSKRFRQVKSDLDTQGANKSSDGQTIAQ